MKGCLVTFMDRVCCERIREGSAANSDLSFVISNKSLEGEREFDRMSKSLKSD